MAKFKFPLAELNEFWEVMRFDAVVGGYTYKGHRVFVVCAKSKAEALESMQGFKEKRCE